MDWLSIVLALILSIVSFILGFNTGFRRGSRWIINEWRDWLENFEEENENEQRKINRPGQSKR